jgi:hypothetical protein
MRYYVETTPFYTPRNNPWFVEASAVLNPSYFQTPETPATDEIRRNIENGSRFSLPEHNFIHAVSIAIRTEIRNMVRSTGVMWNRSQIDERVGGSLYIDNLENGAQTFQTGFILARNINYEVLLRLFSRLIQSNENLTVFAVKWKFNFDPRTFTFGNGNCKLPPWIKKSSYLSQTWQQQKYGGRVLNCAAFSIAYKMNPMGRSKKRIEEVKIKAVDIMKKCGWSEDVTVYQILSTFPKHYPDYRITIVYLALADQSSRTVEGKDYKYETVGESSRLTKECTEKTIYLIYDPEHKHYGLCHTPTGAYQFYHPKKMFCSRCVCFFNEFDGCKCSPEVSFRKLTMRPPNKCPYCKRTSCKGEGCFRNCKFCGSKFKTGYNLSEGSGHR